MEPLTQTYGGSVIDTFAVWATGNAQNPILSFFIMAEREISISVNNDGTFDPNLWGIGNWHFCCTSNGKCTKPNVVIFHNGLAGNFDFRQQWMEPLTQTYGGSVIDTFAVRVTGNAQNSICHFHNGRAGNFDFRQQRWNPWPKLMGGSVIDTFAVWATGNAQNPILSFFIMAEWEILISVNNDGTLDPNLWGSVIDTFAVWVTGNAQNPILSFFIMAEREISISVNNDGTLDPNLWGVSNWHFCCTSDGERTKPNFVIFHNGWAGNFDFRQQR